MAADLGISPEKLREFCQVNRIRRLSLFGSTQRGEQTEDSDIDLLVEFEPDTRLGLIGLAALELELSELMGRRVDLRTPAELSRYFRDKVLESAEVLCAL